MRWNPSFLIFLVQIVSSWIWVSLKDSSVQNQQNRSWTTFDCESWYTCLTSQDLQKCLLELTSQRDDLNCQIRETATDRLHHSYQSYVTRLHHQGHGDRNLAKLDSSVGEVCPGNRFFQFCSCHFSGSCQVWSHSQNQVTIKASLRRANSLCCWTACPVLHRLQNLHPTSNFIVFCPSVMNYTQFKRVAGEYEYQSFRIKHLREEAGGLSFSTETWETLLFTAAVVWVRSRLQTRFRSAFSWTEPEDKSAERFSILWQGKCHTMRAHCVRMVAMCGMRKGAGNIWWTNSTGRHNHLTCKLCHAFTLLGEYPGDKWLFITLRVWGNHCC